MSVTSKVSSRSSNRSKPHPKADRKTHRMAFRCSDPDLAIIEANAAARGLKLSDYLREVALGQAPRRRIVAPQRVTAPSGKAKSDRDYCHSLPRERKSGCRENGEALRLRERSRVHPGAHFYFAGRSSRRRTGGGGGAYRCRARARECRREGASRRAARRQSRLARSWRHTAAVH